MWSRRLWKSPNRAHSTSPHVMMLTFSYVAHDTDVCVWLAYRRGDGRFSRCRSRYVLVVREQPCGALTVWVWISQRRNEPPCVPGHPAGQGQVRDHAVKVPSYGRAKARGRAEALRLLCRVPQDVHRYEPGRGRREGRREAAVRFHCEYFLTRLWPYRPAWSARILISDVLTI